MDGRRLGYSRRSATAGTCPVSDPPSTRPARLSAGPAARADRGDRRTFFERLVELISPGPDSRDELIRLLATAEHRELIEPESRLMLEGVLRMAEMSAGDVMVAAPRMDLLDIDAQIGRASCRERV